LEHGETWPRWIQQNGKAVFKAFLSQIKWLLIETIDEFLSAYIVKGKCHEDFVQNAL